MNDDGGISENRGPKLKLNRTEVISLLRPKVKLHRREEISQIFHCRETLCGKETLKCHLIMKNAKHPGIT